jgi:hypothetical protein
MISDIVSACVLCGFFFVGLSFNLLQCICLIGVQHSDLKAKKKK